MDLIIPRRSSYCPNFATAPVTETDKWLGWADTSEIATLKLNFFVPVCHAIADDFVIECRLSRPPASCPALDIRPGLETGGETPLTFYDFSICIDFCLECGHGVSVA